MKNLLISLKDICKQHLLEEKILVVQSLSAGQQIIQALGNAGYPCVNLKVETLNRLAQKSCEQYLQKNGLEIIPNNLANHLMLDVLKKLSGSLKYFNNIEITPGIGRAIFSAIYDIKMAGLTVQDMDDDLFVNPYKAEDLKQILKEYEQVLHDKDYIDTADVFKIALTMPSFMKGQPIFIIPSNLTAHLLEKQFLEQITGSNFKIIYLTPVKGLNRQGSYLFTGSQEETVPQTDKERLNLLYCHENAIPPFSDGTVELFRAYGEYNEVSEIIRRIRNNKLALDKIAVHYISREPYTQLFYGISQSLGLPVTYGEGISIRNSRPGRLFFGLLDWINSNFDASRLHSLINGGDFTIHDTDAPAPSQVARLLRKSGIGWGRDRYLTCLDELISDNGDVFSDDGAVWVRDFINKVFTWLPEPNIDGEVSYSSYIAGLIHLIEEVSRITGETDAEARAAILGELNTIAQNAEENLRVEEVVKRLSGIIDGIRINRSGPKPGFLHICHYSKGVWVNRPHNFVVGLDANRFSGQAKEDAVLLDTEREKLGRGLMLKREQTKEYIYEMAQLLASVPGRVTLSYSAFDTVENREVFPSSVLLETYRLLTGDYTKDYQQLLSALGDKKGYVPCQADDALDEGEWWLTHGLARGGLTSQIRAVMECYGNLSSGLKAFDNRFNSSFTSFDGNIDVDRTDIDPRINHEAVVSSSQLESLAHCPYRYFLNYILGIRPPDDIQFDPGVWLDPATRGSLLHEIFEVFYKELRKRNEKPDLQHENLLYRAAEDIIARYKESLPPPSDVVFEIERRELLDSCRVFLASEAEQCQGVTPCYFELAFGIKGEGHEELGEISAVPIELPNGDRFYLRGRVDRADQAADGSFKTLDYKTGSTYVYEEQKYFRGGRQLQHTLYAIALEKILRDSAGISNPAVSEGGYIFPTVKGEGRRIMRSQGKRQNLYEILENLLDIMASGAFNMSDDPGDCKFCDYTEVCQREIVEDYIRQILENQDNSSLKSFRRLRIYD